MKLILPSLLLTMLAFSYQAQAYVIVGPKTKICNTTKSPQFVAETQYAGQGKYTAVGWTKIAAGDCRVFYADSFYIAKQKGQRITGWKPLKKDRSQFACVGKTNTNFSSPISVGNQPTRACKDGHRVRFRVPVQAASLTQLQNLVIKPAKRIRHRVQ